MLCRIVSVSILMISTACATNKPGWSGAGATPFDTAQQICRAEAANSSDFDPVFLSCMRRHGWSQNR